MCVTCLFLSCNAGPIDRNFELILCDEKGDIINTKLELEYFEISLTNSCDTSAYETSDIFLSSTGYELNFHISYTYIKSKRNKKRDDLSKQLRKCIGLNVIDKNDEYKPKILYPLGDYIKDGNKILIKLEKK